MKYLIPLLAVFCFTFVGCKSTCCGECGGDKAAHGHDHAHDHAHGDKECCGEGGKCCK